MNLANMNKELAYTTEDTMVPCSDGYMLAASIYRPKINYKGAILIGPATGIKRQFYTGIATYLAENGFGIITYDNRGIGESLHGNVKSNNATLQSWGELDQPAVLSSLIKCFPNTTYHLLGHSAGGQLFGLYPSAQQFSSVFNYACSSGSLKNMAKKHLGQAHFFMNFFIPISNALFGCTKANWVGMGEPLPKGVAQQWQEWCNGSGYVKMGFEKTIDKHYFDSISLPSMWVNAADDSIANNANVLEMINVFSNLSAERETLYPQNYGFKEIGHMKFFSRKSQPLWKLPLRWFEKHVE